MGDVNMESYIRGIDYKTNKPIEVVTEDGYIKDIIELSNESKENLIIAPGLIDIQINGYKGFDFNKEPLSLDEWESIADELGKVGVTTFYPTIITSSIEELKTIFEKNLDILKEIEVSQMIGGFHLEGPYISNVDGPRGAHAKEHIKSPDWREFVELQEKADGKIKIVTLSPEWEGSVEFIKQATKEGVKVAIGHTAANTEQIIEAVQAGAILSTHLGNGAHVTLPRHPNYIWDQLAQDRLWASVISDGHHLPQHVLKVFHKVKQDQLILISDSVALAGMGPGEYTTAVGGEVVLTKSGRLHLKESSSLLAGSAQNLLQGVENMVKYKVAGLTEALNKATIYPATLMELEQKNGIEVGAPADLILLNHTGDKLEVVKTFKSGKEK